MSKTRRAHKRFSDESDFNESEKRRRRDENRRFARRVRTANKTRNFSQYDDEETKDQ
jgi:hypothetical protein